MTVRRVLVAKNIGEARLKKIMRYTRKMSKYGVFVEVEDTGTQKVQGSRKGQIENTFNVEMFAPKLHTDILGNTAIRSL
jgi:hypothetical protein